jgi:nucleoside-diphosphate-sugar epimerase
MQRLAGKRLVVLGCGYLGGAVARAAAEEGAQVTALTRNPVTAEALRAVGVETVTADLAEAEWHPRIAGAPDFLVNCVSSGGGGIEAYRRSYVGGMASMVAWAERHGAAGTAVYTSSTSVYPQGDGARVDETAPTGGTERAALLLEAEDLLRRSGGAWQRGFILRLAGLYGPGRWHLVQQVRDGVVAGSGSHRLNLVHRDDAAGAVLACLLAPPEVKGGVFNVADDGAAAKAEVVGWLAQRLRVAAPQFTGMALSERRPVTPDRLIVNRAAKARLGWQPRYPTFREGFDSLLSR